MRNFLFLSAAEPLASQVADELSENAEQTRSAIEKFFDHFSLPKLVSAAILLVICIICIKIILRATEKMLKSSKLDKSCHAFIRSSIKIVLVFLAIMLLAGTLGVDTSSLLAILSVAGLGRLPFHSGLAFQSRQRRCAAHNASLQGRRFHRGRRKIRAPCGRSVCSTRRSPPQTTSSSTFRTARSPPRRSQTSPETPSGASKSSSRPAMTQRRIRSKKRLSALRSTPSVWILSPSSPASPASYGDSAISYTLRLWTAGCDYWDVYYDVLENISRGVQPL